MSERFNRLRQLLTQGATSDECLFYDCNDNTILIGGTKLQTFKMPLDIKYIYKLELVYVQNNNIIIKKTIKDFSVAEFDQSLIYFTLNELDTLKFKKGKVDAQLKVLLEDGTILISNILRINAIESLDTSLFNYYNSTLESLQCTVKEQEISLVQFKEIAAGSNKVHICRFIFDSAWKNFTKKAIFKDEYNNIIKNVSINKDDLCLIPSEVISAPGNIYIGVVGINGETQIPTEWSNSAKITKSCSYTEVAGRQQDNDANNTLNNQIEGANNIKLYNINKSNDVQDLTTNVFNDKKLVLDTASN